MKLSNTLKKAFVSAVMRDVPKIDYSEQTKKCAIQHLERLIPGEVLVAIKKHPDWFESTAYHTPGKLPSVFVLSPRGHYSLLQKDEQAWKELTVIAEAHARQEANLEASA